ncbi:hypothetical protein PybrP1_010433 [[Pythium] brassicae (nom. inval.)]|nr:hypothetical protein PybrP1_010433 [[Pythium] brassicae (nom. inval.)]
MATPPLAAALQREIDALERVLFRLASADDDRLLVVLQALLPQLLRTFPAVPTPADTLALALQDKVLQVIAHVKTRLQALARPTMPLRALAQVLREPAASAFAHNFAFLFIDLGFRAATADERDEVLAATFPGLASYSASQQETFFRLLLRALPVTGNAVYPPPAPAAPSPTDSATSETETEAPTTADRNDNDSDNLEALLDFLLDFVLFDGSSSSGTTASDAVVFGLSPSRLARLQRVVVQGEDLRTERLYAAQLNALRFVKELAMPSARRLALFVAGAASPHHSIRTFCDEQLAHVLQHEDAQLEDARAVRHLLALCLGSHAAQSGGAFRSDELLALSNRLRLADASLLQALPLLGASKAAARAMPRMLQLLCHLLFGAEPARPQNVANRVRVAGARLCHWTLVHVDAAVVDGFLGPVLVPALLRALMDPNADSEPSQAAFWREFRQGLYDALAVLATRAPGLVAGSEQAFQVLLVRCLVEEERRTGTGANALKAFASLARAYGTHASAATLATVRNELTELLRGARVFDASKNYARVRAAVATWCGDLLAASDSDSDSTVALRFALLKLCRDADTEVQALATTALYTAPLPTLRVVATHLRTQFPHPDLKRSSFRDAGAVESCLQFCWHVLKSSSRDDDTMAIADERSVLVAYFVQTLLETSEAEAATLAGDAAAYDAIYHAAAANLVDMCALDAATVTAALGQATAQLLHAACISTDRGFLHHVGVLVQCALGAADFAPARVVSDVVQPVAHKLDDPGMRTRDVAGLQYVLGSAIAVLSRADESVPDEQMQTVLSAFRKMVALLATTVATCSHFAGFPRGDEDQNTRVDLLRSLLDGVGVCGPLTAFLSSALVASEWLALKRQSVAVLQQVIAWDLSAISSDGSLKLKLTKLKYVAIENLSRAVAGLPSTTGPLSVLTSSLDAAVTALLTLGSETDPELQLVVGEALVTIGTHAVSNDSNESAAGGVGFADNRGAAIFARLLRESAESRQPTVRRSATMWLLCVCAAGLPRDDEKAAAAAAVAAAGSSSWDALLRSEAATQLLIDTHEFFVTMLNDSNSIAKESAVKGLAYLRLRAPSAALGDQFSDSLFRRLRCFRAFTTPSSAATAAGNATSAGLDDDDVDMDIIVTRQADTSGATARPAATPHTPATAAASAGTTVENAAYREVSNVAADVGDPELMYALLYLSTTDPIWATLSGSVASSLLSSLSSPTALPGSSPALLFSFATVDAAFRASIVAKAGRLWMAESYASSNKLVPWLFLLKFHANAKVADVMASLWHFAKGKVAATSAQEKTLLQQHWRAIFRFLLARIEGSRNFKYRAAACVALVDLLNGADADQLRDEFLRLWKLAAAAVDDVMEPVCLVGLKLYRYMGELSLRIAASDDACRTILLQYLISDSIVSKNVACRALGIDVLLRLVKALPAAAIQDALAALILKLLEYLSSLEMPELQYAQFHVQKKEQLERLRVSISQSGPVGQLLELATTRLKELAGDPACVAIVDELVKGVAGLLRFGVGLNTRVGSANFVATLAVELPFELRKCRGADALLTRVFVPFVRSKVAAENDAYGDEESRYGAASGGLADGLVVQTYCRAAAYLCPLVDAALVREYVRTGVFAFSKTTRPASGAVGDNKDDSNNDNDNDSGPSLSLSSDANRFLLITAIATKELVAKVPPVADAGVVAVVASSVSSATRDDWYCTHVFPGAFVGQFAATAALSSAWTAVLEELPPSVLYAEASVDAALAAVARLLAHPAWDTRTQAARALHALFASDTSRYRARVTAQQTARIWRELVAAVPGRLWTGKGVVLEALVALVGTQPPGERAALAALLLRESDRAWRNRDMGYLESAVRSFARLATERPVHESAPRLAGFSALRSALLEWLGDSDSDSGALPPLIVKCVFEALALVWPTAPLADSDSDSATLATDAIAWLSESVARVEFNVWSVRKAAFEALAAVVASAPAAALAAPQTAELVLTRCCGDVGVRDAKYSMIRVAAAAALVALTRRHRDSHDLALLLTVHRERITETLDVLRASEEPAEQRAAFDTMTSLLELHA